MSEVVLSRLILSDPTDCSLPGSSVHGIFQARILEWGASAFFKFPSRHYSSPLLSLTVTLMQCVLYSMSDKAYSNM